MLPSKALMLGIPGSGVQIAGCSAMKRVKQDLLFWQREVYERVHHPGKGAPGPGKPFWQHVPDICLEFRRLQQVCKCQITA